MMKQSLEMANHEDDGVELPLVSSEHWSIDTGLSEYVNVTEDTREYGVSLVTAAST